MGRMRALCNDCRAAAEVDEGEGVEDISQAVSFKGNTFSIAPSPTLFKMKTSLIGFHGRFPLN
jgi:hypothetical protein